MQDINKTFLVGRLTKDVGSDERSFSYVGNNAKAVISIASNSSKKQGDQWVDDVSYYDIVLWGKPAESLKPYLKKGTQILVEAHLKQDRWEKDGQKRSAISIIADHVQLLGGKNGAGNSQGSSQDAGFEPSEGFPEDVPF